MSLRDGERAFVMLLEYMISPTPGNYINMLLGASSTTAR
jgi:hypothetical protein